MASGLPPNIVEQLMDAERIPVKQMETDKAKQEDKLKLITDLETKVNDITKNLGELTSTSGFVDKKFTSGDTNVIDGTADPQTSVPGDYSLEVVQLAQKPAAISNGFPDKNESHIGTGYIKFQTNEGEKEIYINYQDSTLEGMVNAINSAGIGLKAQVLEDRKDKENPFKVIISGLSTGADKQVAFPKLYLLDGDADIFFEQSRPAQNGKIKIDGFEIEVPDNKVTNLIPGVTLDLKSAAPGREVRLAVKENLEVISGKVKSFVDACNGALEFIQKQNKMQGSDGKNPRLGPLGGDSMLRSVESALRRLVIEPQRGVESPIQRVSELGIEFNRNGTLNFNQEKFNKVLNSNPQGVAAFFRGDGFNTGFVANLKREVGYLINGQFGVISNRKKGLQDRIGQTNNRIEMKEKQLEKKEENLRKKFADLEQKMSGLNSQQARLAAMSQKS